MEKRTKKITLLSLLLLFTLLISCNVFAATSKKVYKAVSVSAGKWYNVKYSDYKYDSTTKVGTTTYYRYKVTVPGEGYISMLVRKGTNTSAYRYLHMYNTLKAADDWGWWSDEGTTVKYNIPVSKGVYYFGASNDQKIYYKFNAVKQRPNYTVSRAIDLAAGKKIPVVQTPQCNYARVYRVTLTAKKAINVWFDSNSSHITVLNSKLKSLKLEHAASGSAKWFTAKQPKGTYYIVIRPNYYGEWTNYGSQYYAHTLYWK